MATQEISNTWVFNNPIQSKLKAYYRFVTGLLTEDSISNNTLTAISDPAEDTDGKFNGAVALDGNDAYSIVDTSKLKPTGNFTIGAWIKTNTNTGEKTIFQSYRQGYGIKLTINGHLMSCWDTDNTHSSGITTNTAIDDNIWHWLVLTWDGATIKGYVDGVLDGSASYAYAPAYSSENYIRIGSGNDTGTDIQFLTGSLDDVFILNGLCLLSDDINSIYLGTASPYLPDQQRMLVKVSRIGKSVNSTNPNDFIFHSNYNTFKIIEEGTKTLTLSASTNDQSFTQPHNINSFTPLVSAFAKRSGVAQVFLPNGVDIETYGVKAGFSGDIKFNYVASDATNIIFNFDNAKASTVDISVRYFILEKV